MKKVIGVLLVMAFAAAVKADQKVVRGYVYSNEQATATYTDGTTETYSAADMGADAYRCFTKSLNFEKRKNSKAVTPSRFIVVDIPVRKP